MGTFALSGAKVSALRVGISRFGARVLGADAAIDPTSALVLLPGSCGLKSRNQVAFSVADEIPATHVPQGIAGGIRQRAIVVDKHPVAKSEIQTAIRIVINIAFRPMNRIGRSIGIC